MRRGASVKATPTSLAKPASKAPPPGAPHGDKQWLGNASLVTGILGFFTAGLASIPAVVFGHMGRSAVKEGQASNAGMSLAGLICGYVSLAASLVWFLVVFVFVFVAVSIGTNDPEPGPEPSSVRVDDVIEDLEDTLGDIDGVDPDEGASDMDDSTDPSGDQSVGGVAQYSVGQCIDNNAATSSDESTTAYLDDWAVVSCDTAHDAEVFYVAESQLPDFDSEAVVAEVEEACIAAFEPYVGTDYASSAVYISTLYPTNVTWVLGDRQLVCLGTTNEEVDYSFRDSGI